jgi:hypothetical protein
MDKGCSDIFNFYKIDLIKLIWMIYYYLYTK